MKKNDHQKHRQLLKNRENGDTPCEKVLGTPEVVRAFAHFWELYADSLELIAFNEEKEFIHKRNCTGDEYALFKEGMGKIGLFFARCSSEIQKDSNQSDDLFVD